MVLSLIVAYDDNKLIGKGDKLPWRLGKDLKYFKSKTVGNVVVMGRKTYDSLPKKFTDRDMIVLTRDESFEVNLDNVKVFNDFDILLNYLNSLDKDIFIIGGSEIYSLFLDLVDKLYITEVQGSYVGDVYFPHWSELDFVEVSRISNSENCIYFDFVEYHRI